MAVHLGMAPNTHRCRAVVVLGSAVDSLRATALPRYDPSHAAAREALPRVRRLVADGAYAEAERLVMEQVIASPPREMPYQTVGDVTITMAGGAEATEYRRSLDLDTAIARTSSRVGNIRYAREVFASPVDQVIVCRLTALEPNAAASAPGRLTATVAMTTPMSATVRTEGGDTLVLAGVNGDAFGIKGALTYQARVKVSVDGGSIAADGTQLRIVAARSATLLIAAATSFRDTPEAKAAARSLAGECLSDMLSERREPQTVLNLTKDLKEHLESNPPHVPARLR